MPRVQAKRILKVCKEKAASIHKRFGGRPGGQGRFLTFVDNNADVLGVAHTDTVADRVSAPRSLLGRPLARYSRNKDTICSIQLDDRLGVYFLTELLPSMGVTLDWLLTDCEEVGFSTARDFVPAKPYNWVVGFDRRGLDVVMYQYHSNKWKARLQEVGMKLTTGSYSDIRELGHLGVVGFNWGIGYRDEHTPRCRVHLPDVQYSAWAFSSFYEEWKDTPLHWTSDDECDQRWFSSPYGDLYREAEDDEYSWADMVAGAHEGGYNLSDAYTCIGDEIYGIIEAEILAKEDEEG